MRARIRRVDLDAGGFRSIELLAPGYRFHSGQYLTLHCDGVDIPLSIASCASRLPVLHLVYRSDQDSAEARALDALLRNSTDVMLGASAGELRLPARERTLTVIASGSGLASLLGMADAALQRSPQQPLQLFAATRYNPAWQQRLRRQYEPGMLHIEQRTVENLLQQAWQPAPADWFLLSGSVEFVYAIDDRLRECGAQRAQIHSDVFAYAPRDTRAD